MTTYRVFFDPSTRRVLGYEYGNAPSTRRGQQYVDLDQPSAGLDPLQHKVDEAGAVVEMTTEEKYQAQLPAEYEVKAAVLRELEGTDSMMVPGRLSQADSDAWAEYRQALRDLSRQELTHIEQLSVWPRRPDGVASQAATLLERL